jgi:hypothetical protein
MDSSLMMRQLDMESCPLMIRQLDMEKLPFDD